MERLILVLSTVLFLNNGFSQDSALGIIGVIERINIIYHKEQLNKSDTDSIEVEFKIFDVISGKKDTANFIFRFRSTSKQLMINHEDAKTFHDKIFLLYFYLEKGEYILQESIIANFSNGYCKKCKREIKGIAFGKGYVTIVYYCPKH